MQYAPSPQRRAEIARSVSDPLPADRRALSLILAARAECDPRTARRALEEGPRSIRAELVRARVERAMRALGLLSGAGPQ